MLLLGGAAARAGTAAELDSELLAACADYHRAHDAMDIPYASDEINDCNSEAHGAALERVVGLSPRTPEGLQAKAAVAYPRSHGQRLDLSRGALAGSRRRGSR